MAINTYTTLVSAIGNYMHRSDLTGRDSEAIAMVEAKVNRRFRLRGMEATATGNMVAGTATISLPTGFLEHRSLTYVPVTGAVRKLEFVTVEQADAYEFTTSGLPAVFTFAGGAIRLYPTPDDTYAYTLKYYGQVSALTSGTVSTNFLLASHPDVYLYGSLVEMCQFTGDDPRLASWKASLEEALRELERADRRERFTSPRVGFDAELAAFPSSRNIETDGE